MTVSRNFVGDIFVVISKGVHAYTQLCSSDITFVGVTLYVAHKSTFPGPAPLRSPKHTISLPRTLATSLPSCVNIQSRLLQ